MDEALQELASMGLGNLSPAQLASILGPDTMAILEQERGLRSLRAHAPPNTLARTGEFDSEDSFIQMHNQQIKHAREVLEASSWQLPRSRADRELYSVSSRRPQSQFGLSRGGWRWTVCRMISNPTAQRRRGIPIFDKLLTMGEGDSLPNLYHSCRNCPYQS